MKSKKTTEVLFQIALVVSILSIFSIARLSQNIVPEPLTFERVFSMRNIKETAIQVIIIVAIVIPIRMIYLRVTGKKD